jgi:hypothetical protein
MFACQAHIAPKSNAYWRSPKSWRRLIKALLKVAVRRCGSALPEA